MTAVATFVREVLAVLSAKMSVANAVRARPGPPSYCWAFCSC